MRVPTASVRLLVTLLVSGAALARASAQDQKEEEKKKANAESTAPTQEPTTADSTELLAPADTGSWQNLSQTLFTSGESGVTNPGRMEPAARHVLKLGPVELLPKLDEEVVYDDNVFLTEHGKERDFISRTTLGVLADYPFGGGMHHVSAGYSMLRNHYLDGDAKNFVEQLASGQVDLGFEHLKVTLADRFEDRTDPIQAVFTGKIERTINTLYGMVGWHEDVWYVDLRAQRVTSSFKDAPFTMFDRDEDLAALELGRSLREEVFAFLRLDENRRAFDHDGLNDGRGTAASVGVRARRGDELDSMVRVGVHSEDFDDGFATDAHSNAVNFEAEGRVRWWLSRAGGLEGRLSRSSEFSPISNYEIDDLVEVAWVQQLDPRLSGRVGVGLEHVNPSNTSPTFLRYAAGLGLRYALLANADLTLNWRWRRRTTDSPNGDYVGNQIAIGFALRL